MSPLTTELCKVVQQLFPAVALDASVEFRPLFDLEKGDISSSIAIYLARRTRGEADEIAHRIIPHLPFIPGGEWRCERGYLILAGRPPCRLLTEEAAGMQCGAGGDVLRTGLLLPDVTIPLYARLRLIACVGFQALCAVAAGAHCQVITVPGVEVDGLVKTPVDVARLMECLVRSAFDRCNQSLLVDDTATSHLAGCVSVWTAHHFYDRLSKSTRESLAKLKEGSMPLLKMPPDGWLLARDRALSELLTVESLKGVLARLTSDELWLRWVLHMASSIPSGDLDPSVALYNELASPRWGVQALEDRVKYLRAGNTSGRPLLLSEHPMEVDIEVIEKFRPLVLRAIFLPVWVKVSAFEGNVLEAVTVLEEFIREAHAFLNAPSVRQALESPKGEDDEIVQIVAGINFALSSIIPLGRSLQLSASQLSASPADVGR
jgi:hypothetical protein